MFASTWGSEASNAEGGPESSRRDSSDSMTQFSPHLRIFSGFFEDLSQSKRQRAQAYRQPVISQSKICKTAFTTVFHYFAISFAFSLTSSMLPTYKNACSGRSSALPLVISSKLRRVSAILV